MIFVESSVARFGNVSNVTSQHSVRASVCWISISKDVLPEFHWLFELQLRICHTCRNDEYESLSEGKQR